MTNQKLKDIRARLDAATPVPWTTEGKLGDFYVCFFEIVDNNIKSAVYAPEAKGIQMWSRNAPLIANAPTDIAYLLNLIEKQSRAIELLNKQRNDWASGADAYLPQIEAQIANENKKVDQILSEGE